MCPRRQPRWPATQPLPEGSEDVIIQIKGFVLRLFRDEQGQDLVEYALIVAALGLGLIATVNSLSVALISVYSSITQGLATIGTGG